MEHVEIDNIEVSDTDITVSYWTSDVKNTQSLVFKTADFEIWLSDRKKVSVQKYWDHWDSAVKHELGARILHEDVKQYLRYRIEQLIPSAEKGQVSYAHRKPMKRVTNSKRRSAGSESA